MSAEQPTTDLLKHSGVYALGTVLTRAMSLLLLPVYTRFLSPADYGCIAVIDITVAIVAIVVRGGTDQAVNRYHFQTNDENVRDEVWWSGLVLVAGVGSVIVALVLMLGNPVSSLLLGGERSDARLLVTLALVTLWFGTITTMLETYLRVRKWSGTFVFLSLARLLFNATLNVSLLVAGFGVAGVLWGNLIAGIVFAAALFVLFQCDRGAVRLSRTTARQLVAYGGPLVGTGLLALLMHQADRFFLRSYAGLDEVGIYSLAYQFGFGVNALILIPFGAIWGVTQFEIAEHRNADVFYSQVFRWFTRMLLVAMLALSLFARPLVALLAAPSYAPAADLIPIICMGYFLFSLTSFVNMPATLSRRTVALLPGSVLAVVFNVVANFLLVPQYGTFGAAWVTVGTFAVLCGVNYAMCVRIRRIPFSYRSVFASLVVAVAVFGFCRYSVAFESPWTAYCTCLVVWVAYAGVMIREPATLLLRHTELRLGREPAKEAFADR